MAAVNLVIRASEPPPGPDRGRLFCTGKIFSETHRVYYVGHALITPSLTLDIIGRGVGDTSTSLTGMLVQGQISNAQKRNDSKLKPIGVVAGGGQEGSRPPPSDNFLGALKSKGGAKIRNCQCEIHTEYVKVQLLQLFK